MEELDFDIKAIQDRIAKGKASLDDFTKAQQWLHYQRVSSFKAYCMYMYPMIDWPRHALFIMDRIDQILKRGHGKLIIEVPPRHYKAQPLDAKIKTLDGWTTMGALKVGDIIDNSLGSGTKVIGIYPQGKKDIYKITFEDGRSTECCEDHLWKVHYREWHDNSRIIDTKEIIRLLKMPASKDRLYVPFYEPIKDSSISNLPLDPYLLGVLIGDGGITNSVMLSSADSEIIDNISDIVKQYGCIVKHKNKYDYVIKNKYEAYIDKRGRTCYKKANNIIIDKLKELNLFGKTSYNKFVPELYLHASYKDRIALIQGLMDTDGFIHTTRSISFCTSSEHLAKDMQFLIRSIGGSCKITSFISSYTYKGEKKLGNISYRLAIRIREQKQLFRLTRKKERASDNHLYSNSNLRIKSIELVGKKEAQCIMVDSNEHLYVTDDFIVTHNTLIAGVCLSSYYFGRYPERCIIYGTYNEERAKSFVNKDLIPVITSPQYEALFDARIKWNDEDLSVKEKKANQATNLKFSNTKSNRGSFLAAGRGNSMTGEPGHLMIIDDYCKDAKEAQSITIRNATYDWYSNVVETRLETNAIQLVFATRWHSDDLIGRIKKINDANIDPDFEPWEIITFPAQKEEKHQVNEYDWREVGEYLIPEKRKEYATNKKDPKKWSALFQQTPLDEDGLLFQRSYISWYNELPEGGTTWISIDPNKKVTATSDFIGMTVWQLKYLSTTQNNYYLREFMEEKHDFRRLLLRIDALMLKYPHACLLIEVETGQALFEMCREKYGERVFPYETKAMNKFERAQIAMVQFASGNVFLPTSTLNPNIETYVSEWLQFTGERGGKDNLVDSTSQFIDHTLKKVLVIPSEQKYNYQNDYQKHFGKTGNILTPYIANNRYAK